MHFANLFVGVAKILMGLIDLALSRLLGIFLSVLLQLSEFVEAVAPSGEDDDPGCITAQHA